MSRALKPSRRRAVNGHALAEVANATLALAPDLKGGNITPQRVLWAVRNRFNPLRSLTPEVLSRQLEAFTVGYLREIALTWDAMERRDAMLKNVAMKRKKSVARNGWDILTVPNLTGEAETEAANHKAALEFFYNNLSCTSVMEQNERGGLSLLLRQMMDAVGKRYAVHEIVWKPSNAERGTRNGEPGEQPIGLDGFLTAEFRFVPLWFFEARTGKLRFLEEEHAIEGVEMTDREWLVTVGDGIMEAASVCYMFKSLPLKDWLTLSEKFGMPGLLGKTDAPKDSDEWNALVEAVAAFGQDWSAVCNRSAEITPVEVKVSGSAIPQPELVAYMDRMIASLWRGADLATIAKGDGTGASLQGDEGDILLEDDLMLCEETLNEQVSKAAIHYLFGTSRCLAYLKLRRPQRDNIAQDLAVDTFLRDSGVPLGVKDTLERYERPVAHAGEATLQAPRSNPAALPPGGGSGGDSLSHRMGEGRGEGAGELANEVDVNRLAAAFAEDLTPLRDRLARISAIEDPDLLRSKLEAFLKQLPALLKDMNADPESARVLQDAMRKSAQKEGAPTT